MIKRIDKYAVRLLLAVIVVAMSVIFVVASVPAQVSPLGIVSYWKFDDNSGKIAVDSVGTNHGIIYGATWAEGQVGSAINFDGVNDYIEVIHQDNLNAGTGDITVEVWVKPENLNVLKRIVTKFQHGSSGYDIGYHLSAGPGAAFIFEVKDGVRHVGPSSTLTAVEAIGKWYHVVGVRDTATKTINLYVNGLLEGSVVDTTFDTTNKANLRIGSHPACHATEYFDGTIDEVAIYKRALSAEEIQQHYEDGLSGLGHEIVVLSGKPVAIAGTSLDGNNMLQLDGTLSSDPEGDPLTFIWEIEGDANPRIGQVVSIAEFPMGNYQVVLTVTDGTYTDTDIMLLGVPGETGKALPIIDTLQGQVQNIEDNISNLSSISFNAPNAKAAENLRKAILNMIDSVTWYIDTEDFQGAIDQLKDVLAKSDTLYPPNSSPDWIVDDPETLEINEQQEVAQLVSGLISNLEDLL